MIWYLLRRDGQASWAAFGPGLTLPFVWIALLKVVPNSGQAQSVCWTVFLSFFLAIWTHRRASSFELSLPITARQLFAAQVLSVLLFIWFPVFVCAAATAALHLSGGGLAIWMAGSGAILTLGVFIQALIRTRQAALPGPVGAAPLLLLPPGIASLVLLPPWLHLAVFSAASVICFGLAWRAIPPSFLLAPLELAERRAARRQSARPAWWLIWRSAYPWLALAVFPLGLLAGFVQFFYAFLLSLPVAVVFSRAGTRWLYALPVSPRTLLAVTLTVTVAPFLAGAACGMALIPSIPPPFFEIMVGYGPRPSRTIRFNSRNTSVPLEFWRIAPAGTAPPIRAPWGESAQPWTLSILGVKFYDPYDTEPSNSERFYRWQFERAELAIHGRTIPFEQYIEKAFEERQPQVLRTTRVDVLLLAVYLLACLGVLLTQELAPPKGRFLIHPLLLAAIFSPFLLDEYYLIFHSTSITAPLLNAFVLRLSAVLPQNLWAAAAIAFAPAIPVYWLLDRQFARAEIGTAPAVWRRP